MGINTIVAPETTGAAADVQKSEGLKRVVTASDDGTKRRIDTTAIINEGLLSGVEWNYVATALSTTTVTDDTVTFTFKTGGAGGTEVAVVAIVYPAAQTLPFTTMTRTT